ncbi:hypothetical protein AB4Z46_33505 [Variovorax sp. M-6]|uniref:hypothetical protein n=1 Tax=Variovorax sp. M-6 TaxID=3233041 RepID=UPI003F9DE5A7
MPIDRRTFVLGSGVAAAGSALASLRAVAAVGQQGGVVPAAASTPQAADTGRPSFELRIVGWDRSDDPPALASTRVVNGAAWIAIDPQWRGAWH